MQLAVHHDEQSRVLRCVVTYCPLRYVQEVYCVSCAQTSSKDGHCHDQVYMSDDDPYLVKYREDVAR